MVYFVQQFNTTGLISSCQRCSSVTFGILASTIGKCMYFIPDFFTLVCKMEGLSETALISDSSIKFSQIVAPQFTISRTSASKSRSQL